MVPHLLDRAFRVHPVKHDNAERQCLLNMIKGRRRSVKAHRTYLSDIIFGCCITRWNTFNRDDVITKTKYI